MSCVPQTLQAGHHQTMKSRGVEGIHAKEGSKRASLEPRKPLRAGLFDASTVEDLRREYEASQPYQHLVIPDVVDDAILRAAREELKTNMQTTLKETDIYKAGTFGV